MMGVEEKGEWYPTETPIHEVTVPTFQMMQTEITVAQYQACIEAEQCTPFNGDNERDYQQGGDHHPARYLTWFQVNQFAAWIGARLPTEAEWEFAARNRGQMVKYPWGNNEPTCEHAQFDDCHGKATVPVCSKPAGHTEQGLCDMIGNVDEWVQDEYHWGYEGAPTDGSAWCEQRCPENAKDPAYPLVSLEVDRIRRGGTWSSEPDRIQATYRVWDSPSHHFRNGGRLARSVD